MINGGGQSLAGTINTHQDLEAVVPLDRELFDIVACGEVDLTIQFRRLRGGNKVNVRTDHSTSTAVTSAAADISLPFVWRILPPQQSSPCSTSNSDLSGQTSVSSTEEKEDLLVFFLIWNTYCSIICERRENMNTGTIPSSYSFVIHPFLKFSRSGCVRGREKAAWDAVMENYKHIKNPFIGFQIWLQRHFCFDLPINKKNTVWKCPNLSVSLGIPLRCHIITLHFAEILHFACCTECINATRAVKANWPSLDFPSETQTAADWKQAEVCL